MLPISLLPTIDHARCVGHAYCSATCPTNALDVWNDRAYLKHPAKCLSCGACVLVCPVNAIAIKDMTVGSGNQSEAKAQSDR